MPSFTSRKAILIALTFALSAPAFRAFAQQERNAARLPDFDARFVAPGETTAKDQAPPKAVVDRRNANINDFLTSANAPGTRVVGNRNGVPQIFMRDGAPLSAPSTLAPESIARNFIRANTSIFPLSSEEIDGLRLTLRNVTSSATFVAFNQVIGGVDVFEGQVKVTVNKSGQVIMAGAGDIIPGLRPGTTARLTPEEAVRAALQSARTAAPTTLSRVQDSNGRVTFNNPAGPGFAPITAELSIFPMNATSARLAYRMFIQMDHQGYYEILVDANTGALLFRYNLTARVAQGRVWTQSPMVGTRQLVDFPDAWLPSVTTVTTGNNTDTYLDADGDGLPDSGLKLGISSGRAYSPSRLFDFSFADGLTGQDPRNYQPASVTNLFYFVNSAHDYFYNLGFTETAGNFQTDNFGKGGLGNDAVLAQVQCGSTTNNTFFQATAEGTPPRMCLGMYTRGTSSLTDDLDSAFDGTVALHEYGHGVSSRLVGGGSSTSCFAGLQSGALSEGWSDYFAASYYNTPVVGAYVTQSPTGLRRQSYEGYTLTYEDIGNPRYSSYNDGEIWAATLWDLRKTLGQTTTDRLVINGLKVTVCRPSMTDARDAILAADQATNGGANRAALWQVFARHGLGYSATGVDGSFLTGIRYDANFDLPPDLQAQKSPAVTSNPLAVAVAMGAAYPYTVTASNPNGGALNYALTSGPADMTVGAGSGIVNWTAAFTGQRIKITVTDGTGGKVIHGYYLPVVTPLTQGVPLVVGGSNGLSGFASFRLPTSAPAVQMTLRGGSGDPDLSVSGPNENGFGFSYRDGNTNETLTFALPAGQSDWLIEVPQFQPYAGVTLRADAVIPAPIAGGSTLTGLSDVKGGERLYRISVPAGATLLKVSLSGGTGNADLLLKSGSPAVCQYNNGYLRDYLGHDFCPSDFSSKINGNTDSITVANPVAGDWYVDVFGADAYASVTLQTQVVTGASTDLTISKSHSAPDGSANFTSGQTGTYTLLVTNAGGAATFGQVSVTDALPASLTATAMSGSGWSCTLATLTCTRSDSLASGASYSPIVLTVNVPANAPGSITNSATVSGGGDTNSTNNTAQDLTNIFSTTPRMDSLLPNAAMAGVSGFVMTVRGTSFINGCVVQWNGSNRPTTFVSPIEVRANITAADVAAAGTAQVTVTNPAPGGSSTSLPFTIRQLSANQWTSIGSTAVNAPIGAVSGRVTGISADPTNADVILIATAGGGVWKTVNGGGSWTPLTDTQKNLSMGSIAVAPSNPNIIYAGTGDATNYWNTNSGSGILTSTDGGATWLLRTGPSGAFDRQSVTKIAVHPTNPAIAFAVVKYGGINTQPSTNVGIWKTTDTGATWVKTAASALGATGWTDVQIDPVNPNTVYASATDYQTSLTGLYKSTNGGDSWIPLSFYPSATSVGAIAFAVAPSNPQIVYMTATQSTSPYALLKFARSDNGGSTFTDFTLSTPDFTCPRVRYDTLPIVLAVDRQNPMIVYAGGADCPNSVLRSVDGGGHWTPIASGTGAEHRAFAVDSNGRLLDGTDYGIWRLSDPAAAAWTNLNSNLNTLPTISVGLHPTDLNRALGATLNAGTNLYEGTTLWRYVESINSLGTVKFSPVNPNRAYRSFQGVHRSDDGGNTWVNKEASDPSWPLYMPFAMDRTDANRVVMASRTRIVETLDGGNNWNGIGTLTGDDYAYSVGLAQSDPNTIYVGLNSTLRVTTNRGTTWQTRNIPAAGPVQGIQVSPTASQTVYVAMAGYGGGVLKSTDGGQTWSNISGNLGGLPVWSVQVDPANPSVVYAGAVDGVYRTIDGGGTWARFGTGLPNAQVWEIELNSSLSVLAAATNGRGVWEIRTFTVAPASIAVVSGTPQSTVTGTSFGAALKAKVLDASSNPMPGVTVTFSAPGSGPSATFSGNASTTAVTDAAGIATSPLPAANGTAGNYTVTASVSGLTASFSLTNTAPTPTFLTAVGGTPQNTVTGTSFGAALQAKVLDGSSNPIAGVTVTFTAPGSGASATFGGNASTTAVTNASGIATSTIPAANGTTGIYTVTASVNALSAPFALTNTAPPTPTFITAVGGTPQSTVAGTPFGAALQAKVLDASSNPLAGVTVTFTAPGSGAGATFGGNVSTTAVTNASGIATSTIPTANATVGGYMVTASVSGLTPAQFALTNTTPPPASIVAVAGTPQSTQVGTSFGAALQAKVLDASSNPVVGVTVTFAAPGSGASATFGGNVSVTAVTNASGIATSPVPVANNTVGSFTATAAVSGLTPAQFALTNTALPPASIAAVGGTPQSTVAGTPFGAALQAKVLDASSNPVAGVTVTFTAPGSGAGATFGGNVSTTAVTNASGIATSTIPAANATVGGYMVTASVSGLTPAQFALTNTTPPPASVVAVAGTPQSTQVGTSFGAALQAKVLDASSNPVVGVTVTFAAPGSGASATFGGNVSVTAVTNASGIATSPVPVANNTVGSFTATAAVSGLTPAQFALTNTALPPASIAAVGGTPQSTAAGASFGAALQAKVLDASSNPVAGVTVTFTAPGSGAGATFGGNVSTTAVTNASGIATSTVPVANATVGGYTVFASLNALTPAQFALTNTTPPPASIVAVGGTPQTAQIGASFATSLQAKVLDTLSNPVVGVTVTFAAPGSGASAMFVGNASTTAVTNAFGIATSTVLTANFTVGSYIVTASFSGLTPAQFALTNIPLPPASVTAFSGTQQSTAAGASFGAALQAKVLDASLNPVAGVTVTFTAPGSGASATFNGATSTTAVTNAAGIATSPVPVANGIGGIYPVTASVSGLAPASFTLTNNAPLITVSVSPKTVTLGPSGQQAFTAAVNGTGNTAVTWLLSPNVGAMNGNTYTAPSTIASTQIVILTATSQADANAKDTATITLKPPDATLFAANATPLSCNNIGAGTELGLKFRSDVAGLIGGVRFYKNLTDNTTHTGTLWSTAGVALATGMFTSETASGWQTLMFATPVAIAANTTYIASYHTNGWYCSTAFAFSSVGLDNPPLHALKDGVDGPNGVYLSNLNGGVMPSQSFAGSNFFVDVLFAAASPQVVGSVTVVSGTPQTTPAGTSFGAALKAQVLDTSLNPIAGVTVTFSAPGSGASATFNGNAAAAAVTDASGIATSPVPVANTTPGGPYTATASASGFSANFSLTNTALTPASIAAVGGTPQSAVISTAFGAALQAKVMNASSIPVAGVTVTFTAPGAGASTTFNGSASTTAVTNAAGIATSAVPVSNNQLGGYTVTASVNGLAPTASFSLTNISVPLITVAVSPKTATLGPSGQQAFTAAVNGTGNTAVTWLLLPNVGTMNGNTYTAPSTIASDQVVILTATSQADPNAKDTATITLKRPDDTIFAANAAPTSCNNFGAGTELGLKFRSDAAGLIRGIRFYKNVSDNTTHTATLWNTAGVALATGTFINETASGWQTLMFAAPVAIAANTTYVASYHTNGWYCSSAFALSFAGVDNPPLHALKDGVDGPNGVFLSNPNGGVMPSQSLAGSNFFVDVLFASAPSQVVGSVTVVSGTPQTTPAGTSFGAALKAKVLDTSSNPMAGATVTFSAPGAGASATFNGNATATATTDASGIATSPVPVANTTPGGPYTATASSSGFSANFSLTNTALSPASITAVGGTPQSTVISTAFGAGLQAKVLDASSIPVAGVTVTFTAPGAGASATLGGNASTTAVTNASGIATSAVPVANNQLGGYTVTASVNGLASTASFSLTNISMPLITVAVSPKTVTLGPSGQQAFAAAVNGTGNTAVTWLLSPNVGTMNGNTYTAPSTIASTQTVILTATSQADANAKDTATITLKPPDVTVFAANAVPGSCNTVGTGTELGLKFRSDAAGLIRGIRFYKNATDNTTHTGTLWSTAGVALATGTFLNETASGWQTLLFASPVTIAANTTYVASYHTNGWYCTSAFAFSFAGVDNPPLHALKDGVDGPNGVYAVNINGGVMPAQSFVATNFFVDVLFTLP